MKGPLIPVNNTVQEEDTGKICVVTQHILLKDSTQDFGSGKLREGEVGGEGGRGGGMNLGCPNYLAHLYPCQIFSSIPAKIPEQLMSNVLYLCKSYNTPFSHTDKSMVMFSLLLHTACSSD